MLHHKRPQADSRINAGRCRIFAGECSLTFPQKIRYDYYVLICRLIPASKLKGIMENVYANISAAAKKYGMDGNYVAGANIAGFEKVLDAMNAQGIV